MNYLGHVAVALALGHDDPRFVLGAALPDLASMVGVRLDRSLLAGAVAEGVTCHLAADTAFHAHGAFRAGSADLRRDLDAVGLGTGARRAVAHAGWELLLDGALVAGPVEDAYRAGFAHVGEVLEAVAPDDRGRWSRLLRSAPPPALRYDEPAWVVDRLVGALAHRPRLALDVALVPSVVGVLTAHAPGVRGAAAHVVADVAGALR